MLELEEQMYCSEQICIPPTFPYLLRQYAKAAIRSQPSDLLRWSSAYFRCLSLNLPPPVKVRLEYPIPRDYQGITPGWLKALLNQFPKTESISFKVLWDRWMGACLQHNTLIQILCLGAFDNAEAIPWLKFIALCAARLTDDLTHTMILVCEILTEEPEGGSAMITLETFLSLYKFLAKLDGSSDQYLRNYWFRDSLLNLWKERTKKLEPVEEQVQDVSEKESSIISKESSEIIEVESIKADINEQISCASLPEDDNYTLEYILKEKVEDQEEENEEVEDIEKLEKEIEQNELEEEATEDKKEETELELETDEFDDKSTTQAIADTKEDKPELQTNESVETITDQPVRDITHIYDDNEEAQLKEDLERLRTLQQEMAGETDDELERFKCRLISEMPLTKSQEEAINNFREPDADDSSEEEKIDLLSKDIEENIQNGDVSCKSQNQELGDYEEIFCEAVPGIGAIVPDEVINAVVVYVKNVAKVQHGMVMPRNIRHYNCPPLEVGNEAR